MLGLLVAFGIAAAPVFARSSGGGSPFRQGRVALRTLHRGPLFRDIVLVPGRNVRASLRVANVGSRGALGRLTAVTSGSPALEPRSSSTRGWC